jgi:acyl-CoA thioester hydrolase
MFVHKSKIRIRYAETDQMGYVYYGNYATFFEVARVEALRSLNFSYNELEKSGIMLPVLELQIKYVKPAFYDDEIVIETTIREIPKARIRFEYKTYNQKGDLLNFGNTALVFVDIKTKKPTQAPKDLVEKLEKFIESK